jgi:hypothetical protein
VKQTAVEVGPVLPKRSRRRRPEEGGVVRQIAKTFRTSGLRVYDFRLEHEGWKLMVERSRFSAGSFLKW